jgi:hypothetical protein
LLLIIIPLYIILIIVKHYKYTPHTKYCATFFDNNWKK